MATAPPLKSCWTRRGATTRACTAAPLLPSLPKKNGERQANVRTIDKVEKKGLLFFLPLRSDYAESVDRLGARQSGRLPPQERLKGGAAAARRRRPAGSEMALRSRRPLFLL